MTQPTIHASANRCQIANHSRAGLTMLEVIFAMMVILIGLVAVGLLIPLAGRQAADSYQITQGLAAGESAVAMTNTTNVAQPTLEAPWCLVDDNFVPPNTATVALSSMQNVYSQIAISPAIFLPPSNVPEAAIRQNNVIGFGFCIDPLFWGYQGRNVPNPSPPVNPLPSPFVRDRFPLLAPLIAMSNTPAADPVTLTLASPDVPRLLRVSLTDPRQLTAATPPAWLSQPSSIGLATMFGGDLVQITPAENRASPPLRAVYASPSRGNPLTDGLTSIDAPSWLMTVTPAENTPIIPMSLASQNYDGTILSNRPVQIPRIYNVATVVFSKRDVRDINPTISPSLQNLPVSERVFRVSDISQEALTSGSFSITLDVSPSIDAKVKIGDWLMMSRYTKQDLLPRSPATNQLISRQVNRWYRVVSINDEQFLSANTPPLIRRTIRVAGKPWDWTEGEINDMKERNVPMPPPPPLPLTGPPLPNTFETHAVVLQNVVHVYERQMELQ